MFKRQIPGLFHFLFMILTVARHSMSSVVRKKNKLKKAIKELIIKIFFFFKYGLQFLDTSFPENAGFLVSSSGNSEKERFK